MNTEELQLPRHHRLKAGRVLAYHQVAANVLCCMLRNDLWAAAGKAQDKRLHDGRQGGMLPGLSFGYRSRSIKKAFNYRC